MSRAFFDNVADALAGFLPPGLRVYEWRAGSSNLKVWYAGSEREHYEVQIIGRAALRRARIDGDGPALEIGFHAEHAERTRNDAAIERLRDAERRWRKKLGSEPEIAPFIAYRADVWRRVSELWHGDGLVTDEASIEAAERLATYIHTFEHIRRPELREPGRSRAPK